MRARTDGFTLVELMVVVLIIGILVAVAVPVFKAAKANSQTATCLANQRTILAAVEAYRSTPESHDWPVNAYGKVSPGTWATDLVPTYIKSEPKCPSLNPATPVWLTEFNFRDGYYLILYQGTYLICGDQGYGNAQRLALGDPGWWIAADHRTAAFAYYYHQ